MLTALQGHFTKNKFESSGTPTRTGTVTVTAVFTAGQTMAKYWRNISSEGAPWSRMGDC